MRSTMILLTLMACSAYGYNVESVSGSPCRWWKDRITYSIDESVPSTLRLKVKRGMADALRWWNLCLCGSPATSTRIVGGIGNADILVSYAFVDAPWAAYTFCDCDIWGRILSVRIVLNEKYCSTLWTQSMWSGLMLHETGHALGLDHSNGISCMNPYLWAYIRIPMPDDMRGIRWLYGLH